MASGGSFGDDPAALVSPLGSEVDQPVRGLDDVEVVLDHHHRVPGRDEPLQDLEELPDVFEVQTRGRLVEDVDGVPGRPLVELARELDPLRLAAGKRGRRLSELDVAEPDVGERLHVPLDRRDVLEELERLVDAHLEDVGDRAALVLHLERLAVVAAALADLARDVDVGEEVHLDLDLAVARAVLASPAADVEGEPCRAGIRGAEPPGTWAKSLRM